MLLVAKRLDVVEPSPTLAITARANALKAEGKDVVGFGAGEPDDPLLGAIGWLEGLGHMHDQIAFRIKLGERRAHD